MVHSTTARHGELLLRFSLRNQRTALVDSYFRPPLQVMRPVMDTSGCMVIYLLSPTGGVVQGDRYCINIVAEADTHAIFTTQAATKIYRMPDECAMQEVNIEVHSGAIFEYLPDAAILFQEADFHQVINVTLHEGASFIMQDVVMPGRLARDEFMQFRAYSNRVRVRDERGLLLVEPTQIIPDDRAYTDLGLLEEYRCWGSWYAFGNGLEDFCNSHTFEPHLNVIDSISALHRKGFGARVLSHYLASIYSYFEGLRKLVRDEYLYRPYIPLRK